MDCYGDVVRGIAMGWPRLPMSLAFFSTLRLLWGADDGAKANRRV